VGRVGGEWEGKGGVGGGGGERGSGWRCYWRVRVGGVWGKRFSGGKGGRGRKRGGAS